ncbi:hypothetical protein T10_3327 [Trichinella papuae]|uniref:Uncharacterized protein n=1 Tax=Trichinella papuae TaxID=268474 RepID=A0A0V1MJL8_9BILA|nr:hypothetical protein T10_3327 [Trichinella papuae]
MSNASSSNKLPAGSALRRSHSSRSLVVESDDSSNAEILANFKIRPRTPSIETRKNRLGQLKLSIKEGIHGMKLPLLTGLVRRPPSRSRRRLSSAAAAGCQQSPSVHNDESNANNSRKHSKLPLHSTDVESFCVSSFLEDEEEKEEHRGSIIVGQLFGASMLAWLFWRCCLFCVVDRDFDCDNLHNYHFHFALFSFIRVFNFIGLPKSFRPYIPISRSIVVQLYCETASCSLTTATPNLRARRHDSTAHLDGRVAEDRLSFPGSSHAHQNDSLTTAEDGGGAVAFDTVDEHDLASNSSTSTAAAGQQASRLVRLDNDNNKQQIDQPSSHIDPVEQAEEHRIHLDAATLAAADSAPFARLGDDIDVSLLTKYLYPESETVETAEPWSLDFLCGVVSAQFLPDYSATTLTQ